MTYFLQTTNLASRKLKFFSLLENLITKLFLQKLIPSLPIFQNQNATSFYVEKQTGMALDQTLIISTSIKNANQGYYSSNELWKKLKSTLTSSIHKYIPLKKLNVKHHLPWVMPKIKKMIRKRNKIYTKSKKFTKPSARI